MGEIAFPGTEDDTVNEGASLSALVRVNAKKMIVRGDGRSVFPYLAFSYN